MLSAAPAAEPAAEGEVSRPYTMKGMGVLKLCFAPFQQAEQAPGLVGVPMMMRGVIVFDSVLLFMPGHERP